MSKKAAASPMDDSEKCLLLSIAQKVTAGIEAQTHDLAARAKHSTTEPPVPCNVLSKKKLKSTPKIFHSEIRKVSGPKVFG